MFWVRGACIYCALTRASMVTDLVGSRQTDWLHTVYILYSNTYPAEEA